jgi:cytochrome P450
MPPGYLDWYPSLVRVVVLAWQLDRLYDFFADIAKKQGLVFSVHMPLYGRIFFLLHPEDVKHVLHENFDNYVKGPVVHDNLSDFLGDGIFTVDGEKWKKQRQAASHLFKKRLLDEAVRVILVHSADVDQLFTEQVLAGDSLDLQKVYSAFTMDSFVEIAFGRKQATLKSTTPFSTAFDAATRHLIIRLVVPIARWLPSPVLNRNIRVVHDFANDVIEERKREFAASDTIEGREDVLSRFIAQGESDTAYLRDAVVNFILAGRDTTAQTLSWLSYMLASNQAAQDKMAAEVAALTEITVDSLKSLTYTHACMDETLRLYPPVPIDIKQSVNADLLPTGVHMPPNTMIVWSAYVMGRSPLIWKDPLKFMPERWLTATDTTAIINGGVPFPFQVGPRVCLGMNFAYLEVKTLMAKVLPKFKFVLDRDKPPPAIAAGVTLSARDGVFLKLVRR